MDIIWYGQRRKYVLYFKKIEQSPPSEAFQVFRTIQAWQNQYLSRVREISSIAHESRGF